MVDHRSLDQINYDIGISWWSQWDEIGNSIATKLVDMGHNVLTFQYGKKIPDVDIIFTYGPWDSLTPIINQLAAISPHERPMFILWLTEQLPNPDLPEWLRYSVSTLRIKMERAGYFCNKAVEWKIRSGAKRILNKGSRFRYYGELQWLKKAGILTLLVTPSQWTAKFLRQRGFDPVVACIRFEDCENSDLRIKRDIPVLWLGKTGSKRRERLLRQVRTELSAQGIALMVIDGEENPYIFGKERTKLLNRTKIVLNLLREPWDDNSLRYFYAAENHALIVSEPSLRHSPFLPGIHVIEAPVKHITDTICYYLINDVERQKITESAYHLINNDLTLKKSLSKILKRVEVSHKETDQDT